MDGPLGVFRWRCFTRSFKQGCLVLWGTPASKKAFLSNHWAIVLSNCCFLMCWPSSSWEEQPKKKHHCHRSPTQNQCLIQMAPRPSPDLPGFPGHAFGQHLLSLRPMAAEVHSRRTELVPLPDRPKTNRSLNRAQALLQIFLREALVEKPQTPQFVRGSLDAK